MGALQLNIPFIVVTAGPMLTGRYHGEKLTLVKNAFEGGPIALIKDGDVIEYDVEAGTINLNVESDILIQRKESWKPHPPKITSGYLSKYIKQVSSCHLGAVCS